MEQQERGTLARRRTQFLSASSTDELMQAINVGRQSMYDTFGDKRELFSKAPTRVRDRKRSVHHLELEKPGSALSAIRNALMTFAERQELSSPEGYMGLNAISEFGQRDAEVTQITRTAARRYLYSRWERTKYGRILLPVRFF